MSDDGGPTIFGYGDVPYGRKLEDGGHPNHIGGVGDGLDVNPETLDAARQSWPEASAADFERTGRRMWRDRATGVEYRRVRGCPLARLGSPVGSPVAVFYFSDGRFYFLARADQPQGESRRLGEVGVARGDRARACRMKRKWWQDTANHPHEHMDAKRQG